MAERILIADDETEVVDLLELYLQREGYEIIKCADGALAWETIEKEPVDLAVLDVMMPGLDGFALCRKIRQQHLFPVILLTAKVEEVDKISGLMQGADDYITKPFNPLEVLARIKSQLRRYRQYNPVCRLYQSSLELTPREFEILWYLCENRGRVVSSEELFETVWGEKYLDHNNTVMNHIGRLREKMQESYKNPRFIKTVWGIGYTVEA